MIKLIRQYNELTIDQVAELTAISRTSIVDAEQGRRQAGIPLIAFYAQRMKCDVDELERIVNYNGPSKVKRTFLSIMRKYLQLVVWLKGHSNLR